MYIYITKLASNKIFSPSNKIHREVGRAKDLSAPMYMNNLDRVRICYCVSSADKLSYSKIMLVI